MLIDTGMAGGICDAVLGLLADPVIIEKLRGAPFTPSATNQVLPAAAACSFLPYSAPHHPVPAAGVVRNATYRLIRISASQVDTCHLLPVLERLAVKGPRELQLPCCIGADQKRNFTPFT